eukprot:NODE_9036_length_357_cov_0.884106.p4 GENE.NODE_9036_length_357_cov_0.884106~~NODE_9036_length_357_cov_0.884106.p4  ORF type:complete len:51 (-),score=0.45 NODE_9036_length_357_cov_0.884106:49-201(-)
MEWVVWDAQLQGRSLLVLRPPVLCAATAWPRRRPRPCAHQVPLVQRHVSI